MRTSALGRTVVTAPLESPRLFTVLSHAPRYDLATQRKHHPGRPRGSGFIN